MKEQWIVEYQLYEDILSRQEVFEDEKEARDKFLALSSDKIFFALLYHNGIVVDSRGT